MLAFLNSQKSQANVLQEIKVEADLRIADLTAANQRFAELLRLLESSAGVSGDHPDLTQRLEEVMRVVSQQKQDLADQVARHAEYSRKASEMETRATEAEKQVLLEKSKSRDLVEELQARHAGVVKKKNAIAAYGGHVLVSPKFEIEPHFRIL